VREVVPYGADVETWSVDADAAREVRARLEISADEVVVAGVGRLIPVKGFDYLVDAFAQARAAVPQLRLVLVGDGPLRADLEARTAALGLLGAIAFTGMIDREQMPAYLATADLVAVPSVRHEGYVDGLPNVALEALAAGKPLVASRVGGLAELVRSGENGISVEERDVDALAHAIVELARDPVLRERLGSTGRDLVRVSMSWEATAERLEAVFEGVSSRCRGTV
jgi:glycosyltransferase involved in cell wall biosynthesis